MLLVSAFLFVSQAPLLPVLHEESFLESSFGSYVFGSPLELDGGRLALYGFGDRGQENHVLRREGSDWVSEFSSGGNAITAFAKDRFVMSSAEEQWSVVYRKVAGTWEQEQFLQPFPGAGWARLDGDLLATTSQYWHASPPFGVTIWNHAADRWVREALITPDAPQGSMTCCYPFDLSGNTLAFTARSAAGNQSIQVYVREQRQWRKQAELWPASGGEAVWAVDVDGDKLAVIVRAELTVPSTTAFVFERARGVWRETAELLPGQVGSLALEGDTLVLGSLWQGITGRAWVVEHDQGVWTPTYELRASDGWPLGRQVALEGDLIAVASHYDRPRTGRTYFFRLAPYSRANPYGCGLNPAGSLVVLAGRPALGETLTLGLSNPLGTQAAGSIGYIGLADRANLEYPCGIRMGGLGMDGGAGEWLLRREPPLLASVRSLGPLANPLQPFPVELAIPADPALLGHRIFVQGALHDPRLGATVRWGLSAAIELTIGL